jgi:hypothetical protein
MNHLKRLIQRRSRLLSSYQEYMVASDAWSKEILFRRQPAVSRLKTLERRWWQPSCLDLQNAKAGCRAVLPLFELLYGSAGRAIEHEIVRNLRTLVSKFEIPAYRSAHGAFATWARSFIQTLETGNGELSREKLELFLSASRDLCLRRAI